MSWGEEERVFPETRAERNERDRRLEGLRGDCWCECKVCGNKSLGSIDSFQGAIASKKNRFCYKCHHHFCIEHFKNHECESENSAELQIYLDDFKLERNELRGEIRTKKKEIKQREIRIAHLKLLIDETKDGLKKDLVSESPIPIFKIIKSIKKKEDFYKI